MPEELIRGAKIAKVPISLKYHLLKYMLSCLFVRS
jgi:hypothetical protein